jgi:hypothetical protein
MISIPMGKTAWRILDRERSEDCTELPYLGVRLIILLITCLGTRAFGQMMKGELRDALRMELPVGNTVLMK